MVDTYANALARYHELINLMNNVKNGPKELTANMKGEKFDPELYAQIENHRWELIQEDYPVYASTRRMYFKENPNTKDLTLERLKDQLVKEQNEKHAYLNKKPEPNYDYYDDFLDYYIDYMYWVEGAYE